MDIIFASTFIEGLTFLLLFGILNLITLFTDSKFLFDHIILSLIGLAVTSLAVNHILIFQDENYVGYFDQFEKQPKRTKKINALLTASVVILIVSFSLISLIMQ